jgi:DNA-directed RNA polymerase subunit RPC12/RpoP
MEESHFFIHKMNPKSLSYTCSRCGWSSTRPSLPSGFIDTVLRMFFLVPIRCRKCRNRFYRFSFTGRPRHTDFQVGPKLGS